MNEIPKIPVVGVAENVDPDNAAQIVALMAPFFDLRCVVVNGRTVIGDPEETAFRTRLNAVRMCNVMDRVRTGHGIPVFMGSPAPRVLVPKHLDELEFDDLLPGQLPEIRRGKNLERLGLAGDAKDAIDFLGGEIDEFSLIVGGPLTDVAKMLRNERVAAKARDLFGQLGKFDIGGVPLMDLGEGPRGQRQFNVGSDPVAAHEVLTTFPGKLYLFPTDITRVRGIGFLNAEQLRHFLPQNSAGRALAGLYDKAYPLMFEPSNEMIYVHDLAPVLGCAALYGFRNLIDPYVMRPIEIQEVPHKPHQESRFGEIKMRFAEGWPKDATRYLATNVNEERYLSGAFNLLRSVSPTDPATTR